MAKTFPFTKEFLAKKIFIPYLMLNFIQNDYQLLLFYFYKWFFLAKV